MRWRLWPPSLSSGRRQFSATVAASDSPGSTSGPADLGRRYTLNCRQGGAHALLVQLVPPGTRVLDVGCATGYIGKLLASKGCTVVGIETDHEAVMAARSSGAYVAVHEIDLDDANALLPIGDFDVVLCADVLEHLREPGRALGRLTPLVNDDGQLIISLPNIAHVSVRLQLLMGRFNYVETGILDRTHVHLYTYRSARAMVETAGFRVSSVLAGSYRFGNALSFGPFPIKWFRGLLAYNIVLVAMRP